MNDAQFAALWASVTFAVVTLAGLIDGNPVHVAVIPGGIAAAGWVALQYLVLSPNSGGGVRYDR